MLKIISKITLLFTLIFCQISLFQKANAAAITSKISNILWYDLSESEKEYLKKTYKLLEEKKYDEAMIYARELRSKIEKSSAENKVGSKSSFAEAITDLVLWKKFSSENVNYKSISFSDISRFTVDNQFYPNIAQMRKNVEQIIIANDIPIEISQQYFLTNPASNAKSKLYFLDSKLDSLKRNKTSSSDKIKDVKELQALVAKSWENDDFSKEEEENFLNKYTTELTTLNHARRFERLLFESKTSEARRLLKFLDEDYQKLYDAVEQIQTSPRYIDNLVASVPRYLRASEALTYHRILWLKSKNQVDDVLDLLMSLPKNSPYGEKWWSLRKLYGREMIKQKEFKNSYKIFQNHALNPSSTNFWEAEWSAGFVALRFLNKPTLAYPHFETLYKNVTQPVTLSRAAYWLGLAAEKSGDKNLAISWYKNAAKYPVFFYGQLAIHKHRTLDPVGSKGDIILPKDPDITGRDMTKISQMRAAQVAYLLKILGKDNDSAKVFEWVINNSATDGQVAVVMKIINEFNDRQLDARLSRVAARKNVFFIKDKFQIVREVSSDDYAPLVHAIIKQESGFAPTAVSKVGALGFMQLMPETAKLVAKEMGIPYDRTKLATDINYNIKLGSFYIKKLIDIFNGSEMLAIASYNAGPNATKRWINEFYDPRQTNDIDKVVDWIELITYSETRNYVQRITENLIVYKYLMSRTNYDEVK